MKIRAWSQTDKGLRRDSNQDSLLINPELGLYIVADGMGGHSGGEIASAMAVKSVEDFIRAADNKKTSGKEMVSRAYSEACRAIFDKANKENPELMGMGTTMVMLLARGSSIFVGNVGDSRIYLHRKPHFWQLTEDHSLVYEQFRSGAIKESQIKSFVGKNVITRSVGYEREVMADVWERPMTEGDRFLLCSDGLSGMVNDEKLCGILNDEKGPVAVEECISAALASGGDDNVTAVLVEVVAN